MQSLPRLAFIKKVPAARSLARTEMRPSIYVLMLSKGSRRDHRESDQSKTEEVSDS